MGKFLCKNDKYVTFFLVASDCIHRTQKNIDTIPDYQYNFKQIVTNIEMKSFMNVHKGVKQKLIVTIEG